MNLTKKKALLAIILLIRRRRRRIARRMWVKSWIERRNELGAYQNLVQELASEDKPMYQRYFRLNEDLFKSLLAKVRPMIQRKDTHMRKSISAAERLAVTLRYLATGESFHSLGFSYRLGERTISSIVTETCDAIYQNLKDRYLKIPSTSHQWKTISDGFYNLWDYPFCVGALDGKHIAIKQPKMSGSEYFNYKGYFSIVLLALASYDYKLIFVDVGASGRNGDAGLFETSPLNQQMKDKSIAFPEAEQFGETCIKCHYHIIGDDAFPLRNDIMKPFPFRQLLHEQHIFNYRLSRARRVVENAFGIMANRFRVMLTKIMLEPEKAKQIVLAICCLHNMLIDEQPSYKNACDSERDNHELFQGSWRLDKSLTELQKTKNRNCSLSAKGQRELLKQYFSSTSGSVSWQDSMVATKNNELN
ncbi:putative nuclease HARBI1 [Rhopilema esculentum]|uniref:putative nuclease HARBI1 n=1 Tax=Rhopilema esculentum TaxID=499914 RepID=UPI0031D786D2